MGLGTVQAEDFAGKIRESWTKFFSQTRAASAALQTCRVVPVSTRTTSTTVVAALPFASWVQRTVNNGRIPLSGVKWADKRLNVATLGVIVPLNREDVEDALAEDGETLLEEVVALCAQAAGKAIDEAVIYGTNLPVVWDARNIVKIAEDAGNEIVVTDGANDLPGALVNAAVKLEDGGHVANAGFAKRTLGMRCANTRDKNGAVVGLDPTGAFGFVSVGNGADAGQETEAILFDRNKHIIGVRRDVEVQFLDQATLENAEGDLIHLAQDDMVAVKLTLRVGYQNADGPAEDGSDGVIGPDGEAYPTVVVVRPKGYTEAP